MTGYDNMRLDGRNKKKTVPGTVLLLYVYTSTPPQQYQYVPKETVRHQKGIYAVLKNNLSLLEVTPPSSAINRTKGDDTRYYVYTYLVRIRVPTFSFWFSV